MAGCTHIFTQAGCPSCAISSASTVREHVAAGNMVAAAQLNELQRSNAQLAQQNALAQQQNALLAINHDQERRYRIASWSQTPDGKAYTAWAAGARVALHALDEADSFWRGAWYDAIEERAGKDAMTPRRVPLGRPVQGVGLVAAVMTFNGFADGFLELVSFFVFWAVLAAAIVMPIKQRFVNLRAAERRAEVFGFDILKGEEPTWAVGRNPAEFRATVGRVLAAGAGAFPSARSLPSLELPAVEVDGWPAPIDAEAASLAGIVEDDGDRVTGAVRALTDA